MSATGIENSRLQVYSIKDHARQGSVTFFEKANCSGKSGTQHWDNFELSAGSDVFREKSDLKNAQQGPFSSVVVPPGYELELYSKSRFQGESRIIRSNKFMDDLGLLECHEISDEEYESLAFRRISNFEAEGMWMQARYNGDIDFKMHTGYYKANDAGKT